MANRIEEIRKSISNTSFTWYHNFEAVPGTSVFTIDAAKPTSHHLYLKHFDLPDNFWIGKRVLDIGTFSGAMAFHVEDRGASEVVGIDVMSPEENGFSLIKSLRGSRVRHEQMAVYDLSSENVGVFDVVMFFGVFYHLKHPLLALERINEVCKDGGTLIGAGTTSDLWFHKDNDQTCEQGVSFAKIKNTEEYAAEFFNVNCLNDLPLCGFSAGSFLKDVTNWFIPNAKCLDGWMRSSGFELIRPSSFVPAPLPSDWNTRGIMKSSGSFHAKKVGAPTPEYEEYVYGKFLDGRRA